MKWLWLALLISTHTQAYAQSTSHSIDEKIASIRSVIQSPVLLTAENCPERLQGLYNELYEIIPSREVVDRLGDRAQVVVHSFFEARQDLRARLHEFHESQELMEACSDGARSLMRALRFGEEFLAEAWLQPKPFDERRPAPYLQGDEPYLQVPYSKKFKIDDLRSGDLIVSRGNAIASAAIARMSNIDGQFSHVALIQVDPRTGTRWVLEAHIEVGSVLRPFEEYASDLNSRAMVLRLRDNQPLAATAAALQFERLRAAQQSGTSIPYDFGMNLGDASELFCSEVVFEGFQKASGGSFSVPLFQSRITPKNRDALDRLGIAVTQTFLPSDLDVDPRFDVLAEWKDISRVGDMRRKDAVMDRFYYWSDEHGYRLEPNFESWIKKEVIWRMRRWPIFSAILKRRFPLNMSQSTLELITVLTAFGNRLLEQADRLDREAVQKRGVPLSFAEMRQALDKLREQDLKQWMRPERQGPEFTQFFHP